MGIIIILGRKEKDKSLPFAFFSFSTFLLSISYYFIHEGSFSGIIKISYSIGTLIPTFLLVWIYSYSSKNPKTWKVWFFYSIGTIFLISPFIDGLIVTNVNKSLTLGFIETTGAFFPLYISYFVITYSIILIKLIQLSRTKDEVKRRQTRIILMGFSIYGALGILFGLVFPLLGYDQLTDLDASAAVIFVAFTTYAIVQYKWMNIKTIAVEILAALISGIALFEIFIADTTGQRIYKIIMFLILSALSIFMVKSVLNEVKRKEELQMMSDRLASANDQLRKLDMAKSDFISIASHQLRSPLTAVKGYISLIKEGSYGPVDVKVMDALGKVYLSNERLIQLVEDLLSISRIESGRMDYKFVPYQIEDMIKDLADTYALTAKNKGLYLQLKLPEKPLPKVELDEEKMRQVINNVVDNALKYTERGGVTIRAEHGQFPISNFQFSNKSQISNSKSQTFDSNEEMVRITISDTGLGIPAEEMPYIFSKFSRGKDQNRLHATGTGLGLYVGKQLVEAHHGRLWAESDGKGKGTRFIIELPLSQKKFEEEKKVGEFIKSI